EHFFALPVSWACRTSSNWSWTMVAALTVLLSTSLTPISACSSPHKKAGQAPRRRSGKSSGNGTGGKTGPGDGTSAHASIRTNKGATARAKPRRIQVGSALRIAGPRRIQRLGEAGAGQRNRDVITMDAEVIEAAGIEFEQGRQRIPAAAGCFCPGDPAQNCGKRIGRRGGRD